MNNEISPTTMASFTQPAPVSEDIKAVAATLGMLAGEIAEQDWLLVRGAIENLLGSAQQVEVMERTFMVPQLTTDIKETLGHNFIASREV